MFATTRLNTPLFNTPKISEVFLKYDKCHLIREIEMILLPKSAVTIISENDNVLEITTEEYCSVKPLYIDKRFVGKRDYVPNKREVEMPTKARLLKKIETLPNLTYVWGGNVLEGIPKLLKYYPPKKNLSPYDYLYSQLKGVDCSGLLYALTNGSTLRNTSQIYTAYPEVSTLKPLDLLVWQGHMLITLPNNKVIESRQHDGMVISNLSVRLKQIEHHNPRYLRFL